jgi:SAM-dependent methyltransferase
MPYGGGVGVSTLESDYYAFMGYDGDHSRSGLAHYTHRFWSGPVLELACGRGEFLGLLRGVGLDASGVDNDAGMVALARAGGHDVVLGDAAAHLEGQPPASLGGVFCAHFLEHLEPADVQRVYAGAARALRPGGVFVAVVPNAASLSVLRYDFWRDPTHVRFYDPLLLAFFAERAGLVVTDSGANPYNEPGPPPETVPAELDPQASLADSVATLAVRAQQAHPAARADAAAGRPDPVLALWLHLSHLLGQLDSRLQEVQHQNAELRAAYRRLLGQLYPSSEVYVVAAVPR